MIAAATMSKFTIGMTGESRIPRDGKKTDSNFASQVQLLTINKTAMAPGFLPLGPTEANTDVFTKFEALFLNNFVASILPKASEASAFSGSGSSNDYWNSMFADKIADTISKTGRLGIAESLRRNYLAKTETGSTQ